MSPLLELRLAIQEHGFQPIPCNNNKFPTIKRWENCVNASLEAMAEWSGPSTGVLTAYNPGFDIDIMDPEAADAVEGLVQEFVDNKGGEVLVRTGLWPKRAIPFRTSVPFKKLIASFVGPNGAKHKIEILGDGQQVIVAGIHPATKQPYTWRGDRAPWNVHRDNLPELTEDDARDLLERSSQLLEEKFGFTHVASTSNGAGDVPSGPVDVEAELASMHDGASVNSAQTRIIGRKIRLGEHPDDVLELLVNETMARCGPLFPDWTRAVEMHKAGKRINCIFNGYIQEHVAEHGLTTDVPGFLPPEFHVKWMEAVELGVPPWIGRNHHGFHLKVRDQDKVKGKGPQDNCSEEANTDRPKDTRANARKRLVLSPFLPLDEASLTPRSWLYGRHYQRGTVSITAGPGGMGKSSLDMVEAVAMATGRNLLGKQPEEVLRIWYHNGEDPRDEIDRRLVAICKHYSIPQTDLNGRLFTTSGKEFPLRVAKGYANLEVDTDLLGQITQAIAENQIDLAIFDPLVTLHSVSEIDPGKMDAVIRLFAGIGEENHAGVDLAHHVRKPAAGSSSDYELDDIRGVKAITDAARSVRVLNRMNTKDAEEAGCTETERLARFRIDRAKGNYSTAQSATWCQFVNIELANGDDVGVVAPWSFPGQGAATPEKDAAEKKADHVFLQLLDKFTTRGTNVSSNHGPTYAPSQFFEEKEARAAKVSKAALKAAMSRLLDAGEILSEPARGDGRSHRLVRAK